jgi:hypothetical protein
MSLFVSKVNNLHNITPLDYGYAGSNALFTVGGCVRYSSMVVETNRGCVLWTALGAVYCVDNPRRTNLVVQQGRHGEVDTRDGLQAEAVRSACVRRVRLVSKR